MSDNKNVDLKLKQYIENIEHLESEKKEISDQVLEVYREAKMCGFDPKILRKIVSLRKKDINERMEEEHLIEVYKEALGMN
jgi:uncharacterized protein (UPF0335 family)